MNKYQKAIEVIDTLLHLMCGEEREDGYKPTMEEMSNSMDLLKNLANKAESFEWIPFTFDEEGVLNCELPDIDEDILVWIWMAYLIMKMFGSIHGNHLMLVYMNLKAEWI